MARRQYTLGDLATDKARERRRKERSERTASREDWVAERVARAERAGAFDPEPAEPFQLEPTEPRRAKMSAAERYAQHVAKAGRDDSVLKVRSPRFSEAQFRRVAEQAQRVRADATMAYRPSKRMKALEFIRVATMAVVEVLEQMPEGDEPPPIWDLLKSLRSAARTGGAAAAPRNAPRAGKPRDALAAEQTRGSPSARFVLADEGFLRGAPGVCYVCDAPALFTTHSGLTVDYVGTAHNACLNALSPKLARKRDRLQREGFKKAEKARSVTPAARPDCAKCNDAGSYEEGDDTYTCVCKHGLGEDSTDTTCALCDDMGTYLGPEKALVHCTCSLGRVLPERSRQARKAVAS